MDNGSNKKDVELSNNWLVIPLSVILDAEGGGKMTTAFSYFFTKRGLDNEVSFSINMIISWLQRKRDRHQDRGINSKISSSVLRLRDLGFIDLYGEPGNAKFVNARFNKKTVTELCQDKKERFATIYIDELLMILRYDGIGEKDNALNNDVVLRVFAYLRTMIYRRQGNSSATQFGDYEERKRNSPETYNCYIQEIAEELKLSPRVVSDSITILKEMELIYFEPLPRIKYDDVVWRTGHTIFCNWYKREKGKFIMGGKEYYEEEVKNRKKQLRFVSEND